MKRIICFLVFGNIVLLLLISSKTKVLNYLDVATKYDTVRPFCIDENIPVYGGLDTDTKRTIAYVSNALSVNSRLVAVVSPVVKGNSHYEDHMYYYSNLATTKISSTLQKHGIQESRIFMTPPNIEFMEVCSNYNTINCHIMVCDYAFYLKNRKAI